jgi:replication factor C subunit 3/5
MSNNDKVIFDGFLVDKCGPTCVSDILGKKITVENKEIEIKEKLFKKFFHRELFKKLQKISDDDELPHIIFYGKAGTGKKTVLNLFLEMIFGECVYDTNDASYIVKSSGNIDNEVIVKQSDYHIVIEPNNNNFDKTLMHHIGVNYAKKKPLNNCINGRNRNFKVIQINNLEELSTRAQTSLRRTIEKYSKTCRFVMWCHSLSDVIEPLRSRCTPFHVPTINNEELFLWAYEVSRQYNININMHDLRNKIIKKSNGNLKTILWKLDLYKFTGKFKSKYEKIIAKLAKIIINGEDIKIIRVMIYGILTTDVKSNKIMTDLLKEILINVDNNDNSKIDKIICSASKYEFRLSLARRDINHIEGFAVDVIDILKYSHNDLYKTIK